MHYRNDKAALEARRDDLRQELAELTAKAEELRSTVAAREAAERELASIEARLASARRAPPLENLRVASPCNVSWEAMIGDEQVRFCGQCQKNVYNLSAMTRDQAERLLAEREGSMCVRLYKRADDTVITADCPVGVRRKRVRLAVFSAAAGAAATVSVLAFGRSQVMQGDIGTVQGAVAFEPDHHYVDLPIPDRRDPGVLLMYYRDNNPQHPRTMDRLLVYADGRVMRQIGDAAPTPVLPTHALDEHVSRLLAVAGELAPHATGILGGMEDSAVHSGLVVWGTGKREATHVDIENLVEHLDAIRRADAP